jgi:hypothetical protein
MFSIIEFLEKFSEAAKVFNLKESTVAVLEKALKDCNQLCAFRVDADGGSEIFLFENASKLLLCISDKDPWLTEQRNLGGIVVLPPLSDERILANSRPVYNNYLR